MAEIDPELARCQRPDVTHYAGCACHEARWEAKLAAMVGIADKLRAERYELIAIIQRARTEFFRDGPDGQVATAMLDILDEAKI